MLSNVKSLSPTERNGLLRAPSAREIGKTTQNTAGYQALPRQLKSPQPTSSLPIIRENDLNQYSTTMNTSYEDYRDEYNDKVTDQMLGLDRKTPSFTKDHTPSFGGGHRMPMVS